VTRLQQLEAESVHIMREVIAETTNPVMIYFDRPRQRGDAACGKQGVFSGYPN